MINKKKKFAEKEFEILEKVEIQSQLHEFKKEIVALCEAVGRSGEAYYSPAFTVRIISDAVRDLCMLRPLTPITGEDNEWIGFEGAEFCRNARHSDVFKNKKNNRAHYLEAILWRANDKCCFVGKVDGVQSRQYIKKFPFMPKTFKVDVITVDKGAAQETFHIKDPKQLDEVLKYYDRYDEE